MYTATLLNLVTWTIGYGGWAGIMISPLLMNATASNSTRCVMFFLSPPICAILMTAIIVTMYGFGVMIHTTFSVMIHPQFLHTLCSSITLMVSALSASALLRYYTWKSLKDSSSQNEENDTASEHTQTDASSTDISETEDEDTENSQTSEAEDEDTENSQTSEAEDEEEVDNSWRETANFEGLRNAPPLPDEEENQTSE